MIVLEPEPVAAQRARHPLARIARARVDDRAAVAKRSQPLDEDPKAILVAADLLDVVAEVRPDDARTDDCEVPAERGPRSRRAAGVAVAVMPSTRRLAERLERSPDEEVVGPEVVAPHAHAVHLVDHDEPDADRAQRLDEGGVAESLGRGVEQPRRPAGDVADPAAPPPPRRATS